MQGKNGCGGGGVGVMLPSKRAAPPAHSSSSSVSRRVDDDQRKRRRVYEGSMQVERSTAATSIFERRREKSEAAAVAMESGLDPELSRGNGLKKIGAGLANLGNTCFLNSVLQCLTYTEPLAAYLLSGRHKIACRASGFCAMCAIQNHVMNALASSGKILAPSHLVNNLRCISRSFRMSRQEDAHEYMVMLMDSMHKCCIPSGIASESPRAYEKSLVHKIFGGQLRSQVKCRRCSYCSNTYEPFLDLSLEISESDSLLKALSHFTSVEQLGGGEKVYKCERCKVKVQALKQFTVDKVPYILAIHLKRFTALGGKINKKVEFGRTLNMKPFVSGPHEEELKYTLYGVLVHAGWSTHSGHYYCFIRTSTGVWHVLDDNRVYQESEQVVLGQKAYMLFYVRDKRALTQPSVKSEHKGSDLKHDKPVNVAFRHQTHLTQSSVKSENKGSDLKHDTPLNVVLSQGQLPTSGHAIPKGSFSLNSSEVAISTEKDAVPMKETLLDRDSASKGVEARQNDKPTSSSGEKCLRIASLSKLPPAGNSDVTKDGNMGTKQASVNGLQGDANVGISDLPAAAEGNMGKDLVSDMADNGEKASTVLRNSVADVLHSFVPCLVRGDIVNHSDRHSDSIKLVDNDASVHAVAKEHQVVEPLSEVNTSHRVTVVENNNIQDSISKGVSVMSQNHGNDTALPCKEHLEEDSPKKIELLRLPNMIEEHHCLQQTKDSRSIVHKKRVKLQKLVRHSKLAMPLSRQYLLHTALIISRKKRSFKRKKLFYNKSKNLFCSNLAGRSVTSVTNSAACQLPRIRESGTNVPKSMSNGICFFNSCKLKQNHDLMISTARHGSALAKTDKTNFEAHLHHGSAQTGSRQICSQNGVCKDKKLNVQIYVGRCNSLVSGCNDNDLDLNSGANKKFLVLLHSVKNGDASSCRSTHEKGKLHSTSSNFQYACEQDEARVDGNEILQRTGLDADSGDQQSPI